MKPLVLVIPLLLGLLLAPARAAGNLADLLPAQPCGIGRPAADRAWWGAWAKTPEAASALKKAETWLAKPMPPFEASSYLDYATNGDRTRYQTQHKERWDRFKCLVLGECLEGKGRFNAAIDETVRSLCADPSWLLPAHDHGNAVFKGGNPYVDLAVAMNGYQMASAAWLLENSLPAETLALMRTNVARRLTGPVLQTLDGTAPKDVVAGHFWAKVSHNWNAVCTVGAVGAILASEPSRETRAKAIQWALANMAIFRSGFGQDGYCSEGLGYWNFGFGHYAVLAEILRAQTGGQLDLFQEPAVRPIAAAPVQLEISNNIYPAFADCQLDARPDAGLLDLVRWRLGGPPHGGTASAALAKSGSLYQTLLELTLHEEAAGFAAKDRSAEALPLRSWLAESGVCVARPARAGGLAAAWKGGHNAEHHNHNDVGTTVVVWQGRAVIADPGAMVYRAETFSRNRYRLTVMGSFGHSVPVVNGSLQADGKSCHGQVMAHEFTDARDTMTLDMMSAYPNSGLIKLERQWTYQREGDAQLVIEDRFGFAKPSAFATALVGFGDWYLAAAKDRHASFLIDGGQDVVLQVDVEFSAPGAWNVLQLDNPDKPIARRLGLALNAPASDGFVRAAVHPASRAALTTATRLDVTMAPAMLADARRAP